MDGAHRSNQKLDRIVEQTSAMAKALEEIPQESGHEIAEHVDDVQQNTTADTEPRARVVALKQAFAMAATMAKSQLQLSQKMIGGSEVLANVAGTASKLARQAARLGIPVRPVKESLDIGMTTTAGQRRSTKSTRARTSKARRQAFRVGWASKSSAGAQKLFRTWGPPQAKLRIKYSWRSTAADQRNAEECGLVHETSRN